MADHPNALALIARRMSDIVRPPVPIKFSEWLPRNIVLVDGPSAGEMWNAAGAPYLPAIADCLSDEHPCNLVTVRKSQQTGASILALGWCLYIADREPANTLYAVPGIDALRDLNSGKLNPLIEAWQKHTRRDGRGDNPPPVIVPQTLRSGSGSTTYEKVFTGGRLWLANANTVMDLSSKTVKKGIKDEVSKWGDIPGFGDPETLFFGRFTAFRRSKSYKILEISTPEVDTGDETGETDGHCRIDRSFRRSDQSFWHCQCPECGQLFVHRQEQLVIDAAHPHKTVYACDCGHHITESERVIAVRAGEWIAKVPERSLIHPGFHVDAFISLMMSYEAIAEDKLKSDKTEASRKDFSNLVLGLPYRFKGDAPDHIRLMERREDYRRGHIPPGALIVSIGCDVQLRGIYYEVLAIAPDRRTWVVDAGYLDGATTDHDGGAFLALTDLYHRKWPDAFGNAWAADEFGIDAGYHTGAVYAWTRNHPGTKALQGRDDWGRPALGTATDQDVDYRGRKIKGGAKLRGVGTWPLKSTFYAHLALTAKADGADLIFPPGFCHFGAFLDETYFKQITSEYLAEEKVRGKRSQVWKIRGHAENHLLDCRIYNMALTDPYLVSFTPDDWAARAAERGLPADLRTPDLFSPRPFGRSAPSLEDGPAPSRDPFARLAEINRGV